MHSDHHTHTPEKRRPRAAAMLLVPVVVALVLTLFAWPTARLEPRDLPVGVAGPPAATKAMEARLSHDAFAVQRFAGEPAAREAIKDREVYGAFVATPRGAKVLTASAGSPGVAQMLTTAAIHQEHAEGRPVPVEDVVEAGHGGPAIPSSVFPLILAGILTGVLAGFVASGTLRRAGLVVGASILAGLAATAIVQSWLDVLGGDWAANAAAFTLIVLAIAAFVAGLQAWFGEKGVIAGALTMILIGNPFSGVGAAPEMLPQPTGALGQLMPPGAGGNLLRSTGFFDGAAAGGHALVLAGWALVGLGLLVAAGLRARRVATAPVPAPA